MSTDALKRRTDHVKRGLRRLITQYRGKPKLEGLLTSYLNRIQEFEDTLWDILEARTLEGEGAQLDALGRLVGRNRNNLDDYSFKVALRARIRTLRSSGTAVDLIAIARLSLPEGFTFSYSEAYPKTSVFDIHGEVDFDPQVFWTNLLTAKSAGTQLFLIWDEFEDVFLWADGDVEVADTDEGWTYDDEDDPGRGGHLSAVMSSSDEADL